MPDLELPDGRIIQGIPEGLTRKQVTDKLLRSGILMGNEEWLNPAASEVQQSTRSPISRGEAALTTATNIPFAPRIKAGIAAGIASPFVEDKNFGELYDEALTNERAKLTQAREQYPVQSFLTQLPADIALGPKGGQGIVSAVGKSAGLSGLQAAGETKDLSDLPQVATDVGSAATISALTSGLMTGAGYGAKKGYEKLFNKNPNAAVTQLNADDVKGLATDAYKFAAEKGGLVKPQFIENLVNQASQFDKQTKIGKALAGASPISEVKEILQGFKGKKLDLASLQELDEALGDKIDDYVENGIVKKAGLPLLKLQSSLRSMIDNASPAIIEGGKEGFESLKEARALWSKAAKLRDVEKIITRAEMTDNPATAIKTGFRTLFNNPDRLKYFNEAERKLIKDAAKSGIVTDALRTFGSRLIPIGEVVGGGGFSGAAMGQVASMASRDLATRSQIAKANKVSKQILGNLSPESKMVINPLNPIIAARFASQNLYKPEEQ